MKKGLTILLIEIILFVSSPAQQDTVYSYMPLHIGNQWQYEVHYIVYNSNIDTTYYSTFTVSGDTIMPNGYQYQIIKGISEDTKYVHIDSTTACVYEYEGSISRGLKTDSLWSSEGDWFGRGSYCELIDTATVLNHLTWTMVVERVWPDIAETHTLAMDIGISHRAVSTSYGFGSTKTYTLVYANIDGNEFGEFVTSQNETQIELSEFHLHQNYPNPFNPLTTIEYSITQKSFVTLKIFDVLGNELATLISGKKIAGHYSVQFSSKGLPSGIYFYQLKSGTFIETKKMLLLK